MKRPGQEISPKSYGKTMTRLWSAIDVPDAENAVLARCGSPFDLSTTAWQLPCIRYRVKRICTAIACRERMR